MALVSLPTAGLAAGGVLLTSMMPTLDEQFTQQLGHAETWISVVSPPDPTLEQSVTADTWTRATAGDPPEPSGFTSGDRWLHPAEVLPAGTRILTISESSATVRSTIGLTGVALVEGDVGDPALDGRYELTAGRAPVTDAEIALSASALTRTDTVLGDTLTVTGHSAGPMTVVGVIEDRHRFSKEAVLFAQDGAVSGVPASERIDLDPQGIRFYLPDATLDWDQVHELNIHGMLAYSRSVMEHPPPGESAGSPTDAIQQGYVSMIVAGGVFAVFQVCLLAGAAFVVGTRADQRALATVASVGGSPGFLASIVSIGGVVLGALGGIIGVTVGVGAAWIAYQFLDDGNSLTLPGFHPWPLPLAGALAVAVLSGWIASFASARGARRIDVAAALRGSRRAPEARPRRAIAGSIVTLVGGVTLGAGAVLAVFAIWPKFDPGLTAAAGGVLAFGAIAVQLGLALSTPALLRLSAGVLSRSGNGARLAARDASRNHPRSVPVTAAVMSTVFAAVLVMTFLSSSQATSAAHYTHSGPVGSVATTLSSWEAPEPPTSSELSRTITLLHDVLGAEHSTVLHEVRDEFRLGQEDPFPLTTVRTHLPSSCNPEATSSIPGCPAFVMYFGGGSHLTVGGVDELRAILGREPSHAAKQALARGDAVALHEAYLDDDVVHLDQWSASQAEQIAYAGTAELAPLATYSVPAVLEDPGVQLAFGVLLPRATVDRLGLVAHPARILTAVDQPMTDAQFDAIWAGLSTIRPGMYARYEAGVPQFGGEAAWGLVALTLLVALAASGVAIGLARADTRRDDEVLDAVGAPPGLRRSVAFWQAMVVTGLGTVLGALVGTLPVAVLVIVSRIALLDPSIHAVPLATFDAPWLQLGAIAVVIPLLIALGSWATAGRRRVAVRRVA
jgi:hypothetical protein